MSIFDASKPRKQAIAMALEVARRALAEGGAVYHGPVKAVVPGRTDRLPINVKGGAYVIPADIVSGLGEGNTAAGFEALNRMFSTGPLAAKIAKRQAGGPVGDETTRPVMVAGGEHIVPPETVAALGDGDLNKGHALLDEFVRSQRKKLIAKLKALPGPARD